MESEVFKRTSSEGTVINAHLYNFIIGMTLCWGFFINWIMVEGIDPTTLSHINPILFFIGYLGCCFLGIYLFKKSSNPLVSFLGYNLVVIPFGFIINIVVAQYDPQVVLEAIQVTFVVTAAMMILGTLFPKFFQKIVVALTIALVLVIIFELVSIFFLKTQYGIVDWIVVLIFCGYIGYDWGRANQIPKTVDNAIDSAAALYMDIINLFLRLLRIMGRRK
ncbi:MAG: US12 family protein [candidate division Zixibacteria bacterium]|nr:US12 family protein [candidate division Zixibacteria bacterium]